MILYHGTSTEFLPQILKEGIRPRSETHQASNWEGQVESIPDLVYLSDAYPVYFAMNAAHESWDPLILKVDVPEEELYPDEDFIALHLSQTYGTDWKATVPTVDPRKYREFWRASLERNGNVAIPHVLPSWILDHKAIPVQGNARLLVNIGGDAFPTPMNYGASGEYYRNCVAALFEHGLNGLEQSVDQMIENLRRAQWGDQWDQIKKDLAEFKEEPKDSGDKKEQ